MGDAATRERTAERNLTVVDTNLENSERRRRRNYSKTNSRLGLGQRRITWPVIIFADSLKYRSSRFRSNLAQAATSLLALDKSSRFDIKRLSLSLLLSLYLSTNSR